MVDSGMLAVDKAVSEYDERLYFEHNPETNQWCIFLKTIPSEPDLPLLGWDEIPNVDVALRRLYNADSLRHGEKILNDMKRHNKAIDKKYADKTSDGAGQVAEVLEVMHRKQGTHPVSRIFVP
jgi:hypothetical protein